MAWIAGIAALVAAAGTYENNQQVAHKQDNNAAAALRQQGLLQQQANQRTSQLINKTAASNDVAPKSALLQQFTDALRAKQGNATSGLNQAGNVSSAFTKDALDASSGISQFGANRAGILSSIDAPGLQRQGEAADLMRYGTDVGQIQRQSQADEFLSNMRMRGIRANPWLTALSSAAGAYAKTGGGGAASGTSQFGDYGGGPSTYTNGGMTVNMPK